MIYYKAKIAYDGTSFLGWQKTKEGPSIQEALEKALQKLSSHHSMPEAASRTDKGVHALGQVIAFSIETSLDSTSLLKAINAHLPKEITVLSLEQASLDFHPTLDAKRKEYRYQISYAKVPFPTDRYFFWSFPKELDFKRIEKAIPFLLGEKDFSALANEKPKDPICRIDAIQLSFLPEEKLEIRFIGNRFLYKMVRNLTGLLLFIGKKALEPEMIDDLLQKKKRALCPMTAPCHGLTLFQIDYESTMKDLSHDRTK